MNIAFKKEAERDIKRKDVSETLFETHWRACVKGGN